LEVPGSLRVVALSRLGESRVPAPEIVLQEGDVVYLSVAGDALASVDARLAGPVKVGGH
jgi:Trk K+ transport system NAD-binding subunit